MTKRLEMIEDRGDFSRFMVHLTRDDRNTFPSGQPAKENFLSILEEQKITAHLPHCLHRKSIPKLYRPKFHVSCFSETPLDQVKHLIGDIPGRSVPLDSYGFVFNRDFLIDNGAHDVTYVNSYGTDKGRRAAYDAIFERAVKMKFTGSEWKVLPFISAMHGKCDFGWEREWRIRGSLSFGLNDIVCAIVPSDVDLDIKLKLGDLAIPMYCPEWSLERYVAESRIQHRRVKRLASPKPKKKIMVKKRKKTV